MQTPLLTEQDVTAKARAGRRAFHDQYYAMYSSVFGGIVTEPTLMLLPVDDHVVHRGDGVFETVKCMGGNIYNLDAHLRRLHHSAERLKMDFPMGEEPLVALICDTVSAGRHQDCSIRVLLTRGPGGLSANPYECPAPQLYIIVSRLGRPFMEKSPGGARVGISAIPVKHSFFATIKSCNYLQNVLMTREAVDRGFDFMVAFDERGFMTEGATENIGIVTSSGMLAAPCLESILAGTTMDRVLELAKTSLEEGVIAAIERRDIALSDMQAAPEILVFGTTRDVTAVVKLEQHTVGNGRPGPVYRHLAELLRRDILHNTALQTPVCFET
jgi:branched-chain amino acid aminotransferase